MEKAAYSLHAALVPIEPAHVVDIKANPISTRRRP
jgi:hypothetical protein